MSTACHAGGEHGGKEAERLFAKAVESELLQALVRGPTGKQHGKVVNVLLIVLQLAGFPGFTEHGQVFCRQIFLVVFHEVQVLPDNSLQPHCSLVISLIVNWEEDLMR